MIDKKKVAVIGAAVGLVLGLLIAGIVWVATSGKNAGGGGSSPVATATSPAPSSTPTASSATPSSSPTETAFDVDQAYAQTAITTAMVAASWDGIDTDENRRTAYVGAGFSPQLAASFTPLWQQVFDVPQVFHYDFGDGRSVMSATTVGNLDSDPDIASTTGQAPHQQFRFAVNIAYKADWDKTAGSDNFHLGGTGTWFVTVDEATGKAVAVEQPRDAMTELVAAINAPK
jgi:hypothetical protein